ncbi:hypothetical protein EV147_1911 [Cupriavidus agavae]|uniref:Uncharacterized protein n=1 Tax=Cupriavidus agavae TaxID=1001822 RepID=A0A4Q7SAC5_9BURK|nr:hypothetical protein EV147_1911 [Cupriavidus agavae]
MKKAQRKLGFFFVHTPDFGKVAAAFSQDRR